MPPAHLSCYHTQQKSRKGLKMKNYGKVQLYLPPPSPSYIFDLSITLVGRSLALSGWEELLSHHSHGKSCQSKFGERKWRSCSLLKTPDLFPFLLFFCVCVCVRTFIAVLHRKFGHPCGCWSLRPFGLRGEILCLCMWLLSLQTLCPCDTQENYFVFDS